MQQIFFIGVAGAGMSAIAQYLAGIGLQVSGSDRYFIPGQPNDTRDKLEAAGIKCYMQDGSGITANIQLVAASTAIEQDHPEIAKAKQLDIPVILRAQLLSAICDSKRTIAVAGTSGKSTTSAMLFDILDAAEMGPSIISGAGLVRLQKKGKIGNAFVGKGEWLIIEADESDGTIVHYRPEASLLLNIDKDHKELHELDELFMKFRDNTRRIFSVNAGQPATAKFSMDSSYDFTSGDDAAGFHATDFSQHALECRFKINGVPFLLKTIGSHNMENALAASALAAQLGVPLETSAKAIAGYEGIYRRNQVLGRKKGVWVIDDYAHNPAKVAAAISSVQPLAQKTIAWLQPHGYGPTRFLRNDFVESIAAVLRPGDEIWMSEIYYAGGTAVKDISAGDLINDLKLKGVNAYFVEDRNELLEQMRPHFTNDTVLLLMGARDPGLEGFAAGLFEDL